MNPPRCDERVKHCAFFLTESDAFALSDYARTHDLSAGKLVTAIVEQLIEHAFSPMAFFRVGILLVRHRCKPWLRPLNFSARPPSAFGNTEISPESIEIGLEHLDQYIKEFNTKKKDDHTNG